MDLNVKPGKKYDIIVIGGGPSGAMAGIAAARNNAKTLIVEQYGCLGGALTAMGVGPMMSFHNNAGKQVIKGLPQELVDRLMKKGACIGHLPDTYCKTITPFDPEALKMELETMAQQAGAEILYHTQLADVVIDDGLIKEIVVCNKAGLTGFVSDIFIDATGDGDLAVKAGVPFQMGRTEDQACQPMTMNLKVANVDTEALRQYIREHPEDFLISKKDKEKFDLVMNSKRLAHGGFEAAWEKAKETGEVTVPREHILFFECVTPGVYIINVSRIQELDATKPDDLTRAEMIGRKQCDEIFHFLKKYCAGFENAVRMDSPAQVGVRESRHIRGLYTLTIEDLLEARSFPDTIALGGYPVDIHSPDKAKTKSVFLLPDTTYQIPLRCLLVESPENLLVVGRCISATHKAAAAIRVTPIVMAIGQAGGTLAALCVKDQSKLHQVEYSKLYETLTAQNVCLA